MFAIMRMDFSDDRLSAYLDGELPNDERVAVEQLLTESPEHQQLVNELSALRAELRTLPKQALSQDFALRVVAAALAAQAATVTDDRVVMPASVSSRNELSHELASGAQKSSAQKNRRRWSSPFLAVPALAAAALVAVMIAQRPWRDAALPGPAIASVPTTIPANPVDLSPTDQAIAHLRSAVPSTGEALVMRIRVPKSAIRDRGIDAALAKSGIKLGPADRAAMANQVGSVFRQKLRERQASGMETATATDALFIEAPLAQVENALRELGALPAAAPDSQIGIARSLDVRLEMIVSTLLPRSLDPAEAEGEGGSAGTLIGARGPIAQRLNAGMFVLPQEVVSDSSIHTAIAARATLNPQQAVRVLMLFEVVE